MSGTVQSRILIELCIIGVLLLSSCAPKVLVVNESRTDNIEVNNTFPSDTSIQDFIEPFSKKLDEEMSEKLVKVGLKMEGRNSQIGHWVCDILQLEGGDHFEKDVDATFYNAGGIRIGIIDTGWLTRRRVFEMIPFDNYMVGLYMDSSKVQQLCDHMAKLGGWPTSEGFTYTIFKDKALHITIKNEPLRSGKEYFIVTNDYVADGGDQCSFLIPLPKIKTPVLVRELIIEHLREKEGVMHYPVQRRVELMME